MATGTRYLSELKPTARLQEEASKFHSGSSETEVGSFGRVRDLQLGERGMKIYEFDMNMIKMTGSRFDLE